MIEHVARGLCRKHVEKNLQSIPGCTIHSGIIERAVDHSWSDYVLNACASIDAALSQSPNSLPTPAATPTDSANPPPVESVGPNYKAQS